MCDRCKNLFLVFGLAALVVGVIGCDDDDAETGVDSGIKAEETKTPLCAGVSCWDPPEHECAEGDCL